METNYCICPVLQLYRIKQDTPHSKHNFEPIYNITTIASRDEIFSLKFTKYRLAAGPTGGAKALPQTP